MSPRHLAVLLLFIFGSPIAGCGNDNGSGDADAPSAATDGLAPLDARSDTSAASDAKTEELPGPQPDTMSDEAGSGEPVCQPDQIECKYQNKAMRWCGQDADGNWVWSKVTECPGAQVCVEGVGCTCDLGGCDGEEDLGGCGGMELPACHVWSCIDNCCALEPVAPPDCCVVGIDCQDCFYPDGDEERFPCPDGPPEGAVLDPCTLDICIANECSHADKICDDGNSVTRDSCDISTGDCMHEAEPYEYICYGATQEDAQGKCFDSNLCTLDSCDFGDEFEPWDSPGDPEFDPTCDEEHPDWPDCSPKPPNVYSCLSLPRNCDDYDKCTVDSCDPESGCLHEFNWDSLTCMDCIENDHCADGDVCTEEYCDWEFDICVYPQKDCNDSDPCTIDTCLPGEGCHHEWDPWCPEGDPCLTDDPSECDDGDACTTDFCDFPAGAEYGICKHLEMVCDDGDPETEEACVDGVCVVV